METISLKSVLLTVLAFFVVYQGWGQEVVLDFDLANGRGARVAPDLFGIFFEEINHGGEGGLYGEAIVNRSFDDDHGSFYGWTSSDANCSLEKDNLLNSAQRNACRAVFNSKSAWVRNSGFGGIKVVRGTDYKVSLWVRSPESEFRGDIIASLVDGSGNRCGSITFQGPFTDEWVKCEGVITGTSDVPTGAFQLQVSTPTTLVVDMVSLFPPTFKNRENGMRQDLGQMLADLKPRFMRFPGGCYVEGRTGWTVEPNNNTRWEWKKTIGPVEERPGHRNQQWGYWVSDGQGYHEFLQFCEDIGAAPMFVCNAGLGHGWMVSHNNIGEYIQEVLDAIEYANGDSTTTWGRKRAQNGHPEPFNLKYVEIGNENCNFDFNSNSDQSDHYFERYIQFYNAIKARYPDIITIGNVEAWATDFPSWRSNYPIELVDEHYYRDANFFINNYEKYNSYSRAGAEIYVGEYAANIGSGIGNLNTALAEAVYMSGMENNSDIVKMASFAPIFMNETYGGWEYDIIRFNHQQSYGIPSYYVQKMFGNNQGEYILKWKEKNNSPKLARDNRRIGVGTWLTAATFSDVILEDTLGNVLFAQNDNTSAVWTRGTGTWAYVNSSIRQTNTSIEGATYICNLDLPNENFNYTLNATKTSGSEGFLIVFNYKDAQNYTWWNIGGWGNTACAIENSIGGIRSVVTRADLVLENNKQYAIRIEKRGSHVKCYLDGKLMHETDIPAGYARGVYASASVDTDKSLAIVKLTNPNPASTPLVLKFRNGRPTAVTGEILTSAYGTDMNTRENPRNVVPHSTSAAIVDNDSTVVYEVPAYSFTVLNISLADMQEPLSDIQLPETAVSYSFDSGMPVSDDGTYRATLLSGASIRTLTDGNNVLYTGEIGKRGFLNLGTSMPKSIFSDIESDYTISLDVLNREANNLNSFSWAFALSNTTTQYIGFINSGGNRDWYYEIKDGATVSLRSGSTLRTSKWHNLTYVQEGGQGSFYIDGRLYATSRVGINPKQFVQNVTGCYIGRSPFAADAFMENAYFDNLKIFARALTPEQVALVAHHTALMADDENANLNLPVLFAELLAEAKTVEKYANDENLTSTVAQAAVFPVGKSHASEIQSEMQALQSALQTYKSAQLLAANQGEAANLSFFIRNSQFANQSLHWTGTGPSNVAYEVAEHFSSAFDTYQTLVDVPEGNYILMADAFYRAGAVAPAWDLWCNNPDAIQSAEVYAEVSGDGEEKVSYVPNIYSEGSYTYEPYTYPDNLLQANQTFNSGKLAYTCKVEFTVNSKDNVRLGIRKNGVLPSDWTAFDNFRLFRKADDEQSVISPEMDFGGAVSKEKVFDVSGRRVERILHPGLYIVGGRKVFVRP